MTITTDYAALTARSTPETCRYVRRDGTIIGAVIRGADGWLAFAAHDLLDLRSPVARDLPTIDDAIAAVAR
jgi:hypothetical protein